MLVTCGSCAAMNQVDNLSYDELRELQQRQSAEIEALRQSISQQRPPLQSPPVRATTHARQKTPPIATQEPVKAVVFSPPLSKANRKEAKKKQQPPKQEEVVEVAAAPPEAEPVHEPYKDEQFLSVYFSPTFSPCLVRLGLQSGVEVVVPR